MASSIWSQPPWNGVGVGRWGVSVFADGAKRPAGEFRRRRHRRYRRRNPPPPPLPLVLLTPRDSVHTPDGVQTMSSSLLPFPTMALGL